jgi:putative transposase
VRADKGKHRITKFWQDFIIKIYIEGNKGSKRMNPKQVALQVQAKANSMGEQKSPSYRTVLRVLEPKFGSATIPSCHITKALWG